MLIPFQDFYYFSMLSYIKMTLECKLHTGKLWKKQLKLHILLKIYCF